jgi:hypothetical protein
VVLFTTCMRYTIALETGPDRFLTGSASVRADATVSLVVLIIIIGMLCANLKDRHVGVSDLALSAEALCLCQ